MQYKVVWLFINVSEENYPGDRDWIIDKNITLHCVLYLFKGISHPWLLSSVPISASSIALISQLLMLWILILYVDWHVVHRLHSMHSNAFLHVAYHLLTFGGQLLPDNASEYNDPFKQSSGSEINFDKEKTL